MNIHVFLICYNEQDIIRHTLNHYKQFCSNITVYDNHSTDNTLHILKTEYPEVQIIPFDMPNGIDERIYLNIKNNCWKQSLADYAIIADMDELLSAPQGLNIIESLQSMKKGGITLPTILGFDMYSETFPENYNIPITKQVKKGYFNLNYCKYIIFDPKEIKNINYRPGAHTCNPSGNIVKSKHPLHLLHYKYLGNNIVEKHNKLSNRISEYNKQRAFANHYTKHQELLNYMYFLKKNAKEVI